VSDDLSEEFSFHVNITKFKVELYSNGKLMLVINSDNSLLVENTKFYYGQEYVNESKLMPDFLA